MSYTSIATRRHRRQQAQRRQQFRATLATALHNALLVALPIVAVVAAYSFLKPVLDSLLASLSVLP